MGFYGRNKILFQMLAVCLPVVFVLPAATTFAAEPQPQAFLVKLNNGNAEVLNRLGDHIAPRFGFSQSPEFKNIYVFLSRLTLPELVSRLQGQAEYVQPDRQFSAAAASFGYGSQGFSANDPGFTTNPLNVDKQWAIPAVGFDYAWTKTTGSTNNVVAVIDTGIDATHEDLQSLNLVPGYDFINNQGLSGRVNSDDNGHGTLVAGILGASANNGIGIVGTNWAISVMPVKALDASGRGDSSSVAQAIVWSADHGASIINLSLGGIGFAHDTVLANSITYAYNKGALIIAAAGNDAAPSGGNLDQEPVYPVCDDNGSNQVLGVAASDQNDLKPPFSNYGSNCVDVVAPGKRILSTINHDPLTKAFTPNSYAYASGTSLAAPFVAGEAALLKALYPSATNVQLRDQILATADPIDNLNLTQCGGNPCRGLLGTGRINVRKAVDRPINITVVQDGDLVTLAVNSQVYQVVGNQKRPVSSFVLQQRFTQAQPKIVTAAQLESYAGGPNVTPNDGTLVKTIFDPTIYQISHGLRLPILYSVFVQRGYGYNGVVILPDSEVNTWLIGSFLPPSEGTLVRTSGDRTVYWVVGGNLHPINYNFYTQRGLNVFRVLYVSKQDLAQFPRGEAYIR